MEEGADARAEEEGADEEEAKESGRLVVEIMAWGIG